MSMKRDRVNNEKIIPFVTPATYTTNTGILTANWDTMHGRSNPTNMLLTLIMGTWGAGGIVTVRVQHCATSNGTYTTHKTLANATQASGIACWIAQVSDFQRFVRLSFDVTVASCVLSIIGNLARGRREPVTQENVATLAVT